MKITTSQSYLQIKIEEEAAAVLERKREAEKVAAEVRLAYLRKHKLPTVGLSIIGQAEKVKRLGLLVTERAKTVTRKALKPEYKRYKDQEALNNYLKEADERDDIRTQKQAHNMDIFNLIDSMIPPKPISEPQLIFNTKTTTSSTATSYSGSYITITKIKRKKTEEFFNNNELIVEELPEII